MAATQTPKKLGQDWQKAGNVSGTKFIFHIQFILFRAYPSCRRNVSKLIRFSWIRSAAILEQKEHLQEAESLRSKDGKKLNIPPSAVHKMVKRYRESGDMSVCKEHTGIHFSKTEIFEYCVKKDMILNDWHYSIAWKTLPEIIVCEHSLLCHSGNYAPVLLLSNSRCARVFQETPKSLFFNSSYVFCGLLWIEYWFMKFENHCIVFYLHFTHFFLELRWCIELVCMQSSPSPIPTCLLPCTQHWLRMLVHDALSSLSVCLWLCVSATLHSE